MKKTIISSLFLFSGAILLFVVMGVSASASSPEITTYKLPKATVGQPYSATIEYKYNGNLALNAYLMGLPQGITTGGSYGPHTVIGMVNNAPIHISGTPTQAGTYTVLVGITDQGANVSQKYLTLIVESPPTAEVVEPPISIVTNQVQPGMVGQPYTAQFVLEYDGPYALNASFNTLPPGISTGSSSGPLTTMGILSNYLVVTIQGTPTQSGTFPIVLTVDDQQGNIVSKNFSITISGNTEIAITSTQLPKATVGQPYSATIEYKYNGNLALNAYLMGLPQGITTGGSYGPHTVIGMVNNAPIHISGTPTQAGTYTVLVGITDQGANVVQKFLTLTVEPAMGPNILVPSESPVNFVAPINSAPWNHDMSIGALGDEIVFFQYDYESPNQKAGWLNVSVVSSQVPVPVSQNSPAKMLLEVNPTGLSPGHYSVNLKLFGDFDNSPLTLPINLNITPLNHTQQRLINHQGTIYLVEGNTRRPFTSTSVFQSHRYQFSDTEPANSDDLALPIGEVVTPRDGAILLDGGTVYIVEHGLKRPFTNATAFLGMGFHFSNVISADTSAIPLGSPVDTSQTRHPRGTVVIHQGTVYFMGTDFRFPHPTPEVFLSWGNRWEDLVPANEHDLMLPVAPPVQVRKF